MTASAGRRDFLAEVLRKKGCALVSGASDMRKALLIVGIVLSLGGPAFWFAKGGNTGWTKTQVQETVVDPVTEIEQPVWKKRFVPGIDFLVAVDTVGLVLICGSLLLGRKK